MGLRMIIIVIIIIIDNNACSQSVLINDNSTHAGSFRIFDHCVWKLMYLTVAGSEIIKISLCYILN